MAENIVKIAESWTSVMTDHYPEMRPAAKKKMLAGEEHIYERDTQGPYEVDKGQFV